LCDAVLNLDEGVASVELRSEEVGTETFLLWLDVAVSGVDVVVSGGTIAAFFTSVSGATATTGVGATIVTSATTAFAGVGTASATSGGLGLAAADLTRASVCSFAAMGTAAGSAEAPDRILEN